MYIYTTYAYTYIPAACALTISNAVYKARVAIDGRTNCGALMSPPVHHSLVLLRAYCYTCYICYTFVLAYCYIRYINVSSGMASAWY